VKITNIKAYKNGVLEVGNFKIKSKIRRDRKKKLYKKKGFRTLNVKYIVKMRGLAIRGDIPAYFWKDSKNTDVICWEVVAKFP